MCVCVYYICIYIYIYIYMYTYVYTHIGRARSAGPGRRGAAGPRVRVRAAAPGRLALSAIALSTTPGAFVVLTCKCVCVCVFYRCFICSSMVYLRTQILRRGQLAPGPPLHPPRVVLALRDEHAVANAGGREDRHRWSRNPRPQPKECSKLFVLVDFS